MYITWQSTMSLMYQIQNTLTSDGKNIASSIVTNNQQATAARTDYQYDTWGNVYSEVKYTDSSNFIQTLFAHNGPMLLATGTMNVTDADGSITPMVQQGYSYDSMGRVISATDGNGNTTSTTYDSMGRVTSVTSPAGRTVTNTYNPTLNTVLTASGTDAPVLTTYNAFGLVVSETIPSLNRTLKTYSYDNRLRLVSESNASGQTSSGVTAYTYDSLDRPTSMVRRSSTGAELYRETYSYDAYLGIQLSDSVTVVGSSGAPSITKHTLYTAWGDVLGEMTANANGSSYGYQNAFDYTGRVAEVYSDTSVSGNTLTTRYGLDYYGNIVSATDNYGTYEQHSTDLLGRKTTSIVPTNTASYTITSNTYDQLNRVTTELVSGTGYSSYKAFFYDNVGNLVREKVRNSPVGSTATYRETTYTYDADGNLTDTAIWSDANTASYTHYTYDANGRMTRQYAGMSQPYSSTMSAANYQLTQYVYNNLGQLTALIDPLGQTETCAYDANGNLITKVLRDGKVNRITYNALGSVVTDNIYANASATTPLSAKSYTYYPTGAVKSVTEYGTTMSYTYDERGNVLTETTGTTVNSYTYDTVNNRTGHTLTVGGTTVSSAGYVYDIRNRMSMVMDNQGMTSYEYNLDNTRSAEATYTGTGALISRTTYTYAVTGVLSAMETINANTTLARYSYTYYADGNIRTETDVLANTTTTYTYDNAGRLKTEVSPAGTYSYTHDAAGNRATMTENGTTTTYTYDKNNRLLMETKSGSVKTYTYDANGNMLTGDGATYTYDARGRQSGVVKGTASASYTYYPTGLRKTKLAGGANTTFVWDGSNMVLEYTNSAASGKVYVYGLTLISQGNSLYYIYNAHGDVVKYINQSGTVLRNYEYDAFGEEVNASATDVNPFRYAGQYFDSETGTYYLRARYYSPALGRFTQADKHWNTGNMLYGDDPLMLTQYIAKPSMLAIVQSSNLYVYAGNNPVIYIDPTGEIFMLVTASIGLVAGGIAGAIYSYAKNGNVRWQDVVIGAAIGGAVGLTGGAVAAYVATGSAVASTSAVVSGVGTALTASSAGGLLTVPEFVKNGSTFISWARETLEKTHQVLGLKQVQQLFELAEQYGVKITAQATDFLGHPNSAWNSAHIHLGMERIHVAVAEEAIEWIINQIGG